MKLTVKNFGPIHEAKNIDVKPMTIFVGPSNTGKSYLAALIYSVTKSLSDDAVWAWRYSIKGREIVVGAIDVLFKDWANIVSATWKRIVVYCFGETGQEILNETNNLVIRVSNDDGDFVLDLINPEKSKLAMLHKKKVWSKMEDYLSSQEIKHINAANDEVALLKFETPFVASIFTLFSSVLLSKKHEIDGARSSNYYLPAIRGSMVQNHRAFVSKLIESAPTAGLDPLSPMPTFTGVLADFMQKLVAIADAIDLSARAKPQKIARIGEKMEKEILEGEIEVKNNVVRYPEFRYLFTRAGRKHNLPMINTSAMVSELAPISLFIRYYTKPGDTLIIEEPEAHLHPGAQNDISDAMVQLVNAGVNVLMTTHSDNILEKIGNCVLREKVGRTKEEKTTYTLPENEIAVYLFQKSDGKEQQNTKVKSVKFSKNSGFVTADHLAVTSSLYNETINLMDKRDNGDD